MYLKIKQNNSTSINILSLYSNKYRNIYKSLFLDKFMAYKTITQGRVKENERKNKTGFLKGGLIALTIVGGGVLALQGLNLAVDYPCEKTKINTQIQENYSGGLESSISEDYTFKDLSKCAKGNALILLGALPILALGYKATKGN
jgi:hypothetical protein